MSKPKTIMVEGTMAHSGQDASGGEFDLEGIAYKTFLLKGYMTSQCSASPKTEDIAGIPKSIVRDGDKIKLTAEVFNPTLIGIFEQKPPIEMGFALAGFVHARTGNKITKCEVRSVALVLASHLADPRCTCQIVNPKE